MFIQIKGINGCHGLDSRDIYYHNFIPNDKESGILYVYANTTPRDFGHNIMITIFEANITNETYDKFVKDMQEASVTELVNKKV